MKKNKPLSVVLASALVVSIMVPQKGFSAQEPTPAPFFSMDHFAHVFDDISNQVKLKFGELVNMVTGAHEIIEIQKLDRSVLKIFEPKLVEDVLSNLTNEVESQIKELVAVWASKGFSLDPSAQLGIIKTAAGQNAILDLAEKNLTSTENEIIDLLITLHGNGKLIPFISTLIENLKQDQHLGNLVAAISPDEKLMLLSTINSTIHSTASLRKFSKQTWTELSQDLENKLNHFERNGKQARLSDPDFMSELSDIAHAKFTSTQNVRLLVNGPASFALRDSAMTNAKQSINMITWAVLDDKTGTELANLLIEKAKQGIPVRLVVDGQVSHQAGYKQQVERMEKNGVQVVRWANAEAGFMGQHRKILIIDEALTILGGMNPGDTYSHKAGEPKNLWRDTDVAIEGEAVQETQKLFAQLWNQQVVEQKLSYKQITKIKAQAATHVDGRAMIINHQPQATNDQHEILLATMKAIRGAEKTVDIENAYVIVFPSLLNEIKAAVERGVRVRVLTNSTDSVDEPVVALPIVRSAKKLADVGAEVYLRKGSTLHSKYMVVDQRLLLIGSYNYHPRSERVEGEAIAVFDHEPVAIEATQAFENDISSASATKLERAIELVLPVNGSTLLPLRMFYDQL